MITIDIKNINTEEFWVRTFNLGGEDVYLVNHSINGVKWTRENLIFRSSVWNSKGEPVSLSFPKFFNLNERPELSPAITPPFSFMEKLDGSTLIVSRYKGTTILRTRGSIDARAMPNGHEIDLLREKYSNFFNDFETDDTCDCSYLFEWVSPQNQIVLSYPNPELYLTAIVDHQDYSLFPQIYVDNVASNFGLKRPKVYRYDSLEELMAAVFESQIIEGVCIYFNNDQEIRKCKSLWYLKLHAVKSNLSVKNILNLWLVSKLPYETFFEEVKQQFDYECVEALKKICNDNNLFDRIMNKLTMFEDIFQWVTGHNHLDQKEFAFTAKEKWRGEQLKMCFVYRRGQSAEKIVNRQILAIADEIENENKSL